jgi:5'-nucleotidase
MKDYLRPTIPITKPIVLIDMDGVLCNFGKRKEEFAAKGITGHRLWSHPDAYRDLDPIEGAIDAWHSLQEKYETYIVSTPPWSGPDAWSAKRLWAEKFLGPTAKHKLFLCHNKGLVRGDYLIDDRIANGVADFQGKHIHFGTSEFPDWNSVLNFLIK